jgi:glutamate-1-semialdehyde 2,1-aminomutase
MTAPIHSAAVHELTANRERRLWARLPRSRELFERARKVMPLGVPSSFQAVTPHPIYIERGQGSRITDVDGNEYLDCHNGFGAMVAGHGNPVIARAISAAAATGTQFAAPSLASVEVAEELARRFRLPMVRFSNSGTEATLDAIHLARAFTGKDVIVKIEGSYHGHHGAAMVSVHPPLELAGPPEHPRSVPFSDGLLASELSKTLPIPFNDVDHLRHLLESRRDVAALIIEPIMMNIGIVMPAPGYLEAVRELTARHGVVLIYDEVKTAITIAAGGVVEHAGVVPDIVCVAKAVGGGTPLGAIIGSFEIMELITSSRVKQLGTFNGNALAMAAARATLLEVMDSEAYARLERADRYLRAKLDAIIDRYGLPAYTVGLRAKGCVMFSARPIVDYRSWATHLREDLNRLAWLYHLTSGVYMAPGGDEQWNLALTHTDRDLDTFADIFEEFARDLTRAA